MLFGSFDNFVNISNDISFISAKTHSRIFMDRLLQWNANDSVVKRVAFQCVDSFFFLLYPHWVEVVVTQVWIDTCVIDYIKSIFVLIVVCGVNGSFAWFGCFVLMTVRIKPFRTSFVTVCNVETSSCVINQFYLAIINFKLNLNLNCKLVASS